CPRHYILAPCERIDKCGNLPRPASLRLHAVCPEGERKEVNLAERSECPARPGVGFDRLTEVIRYCGFGGIANRRVGSVPSAVGPGGVYLALAELGHPAGTREALHVVPIHLAPDALRSPRAVPLQV